MANPWEFFSAERIAEVTQCPVTNVRENWPKLVEQLVHCGINDRAVQVAMIGTVAIESASTFKPVREAFYLGEPEPAESTRRTFPYYPWYGRGYIQLTHEGNYRTYGKKVDELWQAGGAIDLIARPDDALNPDISAAVSAVYFRDHGGDRLARIPAAARVGNWREVRRLVQGGAAGLDRLENIAAALASRVDETGPTTSFKYAFPVDNYTSEVPLHWGSFPGGSDLFAPKGTPVRAIADGVVVFRQEWSAIGGNCLQIEHTNGDKLQSYYAHGDRVPSVKMGERVKSGQFLFGVGDSGNAFGKGDHLHFGMGEEILTGSGPSGGCGSNYDAVALLRGLLASKPPLPGVPDDVAALKAENARLQTQVNDLTTALAEVCDVVADVHQGQVDKARAIREQFIGKRPAA